MLAVVAPVSASRRRLAFTTGRGSRRSPIALAATRVFARVCWRDYPTAAGRRCASCRSRDGDDFTIALLDAWAVTSEVLTFYQERIANESYLRTATERLSILEQSRLLGYQLAPGLAASSYLAFTMETAPGAPELAAKPVTIVIGTKVQSVPGPDEQPQTFETIEAIEARHEWNALQAQLSETQTLAWNMNQLWLDGASLNLNIGDVAADRCRQWRWIRPCAQAGDESESRRQC